MKPLGIDNVCNRVIVKQCDAKKVIGSFVIPETYAEKNFTGQVIAVSEFYESTNGRVYPKCKVGDIVLYDKYAETCVEVNGVELLIINEPQIFAILNN